MTVPRLLAVDVAKLKAGLCWYEGAQRVAQGVLDEVADKGWRLSFRAGKDVHTADPIWFASRFLAWRAIVCGWPVGGTGWAFGWWPDYTWRDMTIDRKATQVQVVSGVHRPDVPPFQAINIGPTTIAMERGHGRSPFAVDTLALVRGTIDTLVNELEVRQPTDPQRQVLEVHSSTWAGIVGKHFGQPFPAASKDRKAHSIKLADRQLGFKLKKTEDDIADAVNLALAVTKTGTVR